jgi:hypothetical protein
MEKILYYDGYYLLEKIETRKEFDSSYMIYKNVDMPKQYKRAEWIDGEWKETGEISTDKINSCECIQVDINDDGQSIQYYNDIGDFRDIPDEILALLKV